MANSSFIFYPDLTTFFSSKTVQDSCAALGACNQTCWTANVTGPDYFSCMCSISPGGCADPTLVDALGLCLQTNDQIQDDMSLTLYQAWSYACFNPLADGILSQPVSDLVLGYSSSVLPLNEARFLHYTFTPSDISSAPESAVSLPTFTGVFTSTPSDVLAQERVLAHVTFSISEQPFVVIHAFHDPYFSAGPQTPTVELFTGTVSPPMALGSIPGFANSGRPTSGVFTATNAQYSAYATITVVPPSQTMESNSLSTETTPLQIPNAAATTTSSAAAGPSLGPSRLLEFVPFAALAFNVRARSL